VTKVVSRLASLVLLLSWAAPAGAAQDPVGVWNLQIKVGNVGAGVRTVLLKIDRVDGKLSAQVSGLRQDMRPADGVRLEKETLIVEYGAYVYKLVVDGSRLRGTVSNPAGSQQVEGTRQASMSFFGDEKAEFKKEWIGVLGPRAAPIPADEADPAAWTRSRVSVAGDLVLWMRRTPVDFTNTAKFADQLMQYAGRSVAIAGTWRTDRIEIDEVKPGPPPRRP
jgi:hypothetical protein